MSYNSILGQSSMALDETRNKVYRRALKDIVTPDSVVLDLGAGLGPFGLIAAKLGAHKVYLVEPQHIIHTVKNIVKQNNLQDVIECIQGTAENVKLPEKVDIITSCFTGNFLLSEDLLPSLYAARDKFLKADGVLLPDSGSMYAVPISIPKIFARRVESYSKPHLGIDYSYYRQHAANNGGKLRNVKPANYLAKPQHIQTLDFYTEKTARCDHALEFKASRNAKCHGFLGWFNITLGKHKLSTAPDAPPVHWSPLWYPVDPPLVVKKNDIINLKVKKPEKKPWSWIMQVGAEKRAHSHFLLNAAQRGKVTKKAMTRGMQKKISAAM